MKPTVIKREHAPGAKLEVLLAGTKIGEELFASSSATKFMSSLKSFLTNSISRQMSTSSRQALVGLHLLRVVVVVRSRPSWPELFAGWLRKDNYANAATKAPQPSSPMTPQTFFIMYTDYNLLMEHESKEDLHFPHDPCVRNFMTVPENDFSYLTRALTPTSMFLDLGCTRAMTSWRAAQGLVEFRDAILIATAACSVTLPGVLATQAISNPASSIFIRHHGSSSHKDLANPKFNGPP